MTQVCNLWVKWIASKINQTDKSEIDSNSDNDQPHRIEQFTIKPNAPIMIMAMGLRLQSLENLRLILEDEPAFEEL